MKNLYKISKGQLIVLWIFSIILFIWISNESCMLSKFCLYSTRTPIADLSAIIIPAVLIFYTLGWRKSRKEINK